MFSFIPRQNYQLLQKSLQEPYISVILGARQVGKSTLMAHLRQKILSSGRQEQDVADFNFDDPQLRSELSKSPKLLLNKLEFYFGQSLDALSEKKYLFIDEAQKLPIIFDILKILYDQYKHKIKVIISGSSSLNLRQRSAETLAGRVRFYRLDSLSWREIVSDAILTLNDSLIQRVCQKDFNRDIYLDLASKIHNQKDKLDFYWNKYLFAGGLPEIFQMTETMKQSEAFSSYIETYLERDIKGLTAVGDEHLFLQTLNQIILNDAQAVNFAKLAEDIGIQRPTLKKYFHILEETFIIKTLYPFIKVNKQSTKAPKLYFFDHGLVNYGRKIYELEQLTASANVGFIFENLVINNILRYFANHSQPPAFNFWRDYQGHEIDLIISDNQNIIPLEITFSARLPREKMNNFRAFYKLFPQAQNGFLVWTGDFSKFSLGHKTIFAIPYWMWW